MKSSRVLFFLTIIFLVFSCVEDEFDFNDLSREVKLDREIAMPLVKGEIIFEELSNDGFDSLLITGEDTIKLYLIDEIEQTDTLSLGDDLENMSFDYLNLHHTFTNMFPVGVDVLIYLHDSILGQNIDTIYLAPNPGEYLLPPAPVDEDGLVIEEEVQPMTSVVALDAATLANLTDRASHIVLFIHVPPTEGFVKILDHYLLSLKIGIEAKGEYITNLDDSNN